MFRITNHLSPWLLCVFGCEKMVGAVLQAASEWRSDIRYQLMGYTHNIRKALRDFVGNGFLHPHTCETLATILDRIYNNLLVSDMYPVVTCSNPEIVQAEK